VAADLRLRAATFPSPLGPLTVIRSRRGIVATGFGAQAEELDVATRRYGATPVPDEDALRSAGQDIVAYFAGRRRKLRTTVDLAAIGRGFARAVYEATMQVPYATLRTYGDVAAAAGSPRAWRAAGSALRRCPIELWIPCHRIVPSGPGLGSYGQHDERRLALLRLERAI
jgi:methylated-DNA-[protein]-cysteine S-methyltransferase